ncbi:MAG: spore coat protein U domain-containing protein [Terracidiphilus sp.]|jgi:spore coat protein U-like protein
MKTTLLVLALGVLASALAARPLAAATASASISVTATVQASCQVSTTATAFRAYAAPADAASSVSVACSNSTPYNVNLSATSAPGATGTIRPMTGSGFVLLGYALNSNPRGTANWRQALGTDAAAGFGSGSAPELAILGQFSAGQYATADAYADTMMVVVTY